MRRLNVLVTAASRRVPLVRALQQALQQPGLTGRVVVTDVNPLSPAVHVAAVAYRVPLSTEPGYLDAIQAICQQEAIGLVVPTIDDELPVFASARDQFAREGIQVAVSSRETTDLCNDKYATCAHLRSLGVPAAESWLPDALPASPRFPLFVKPRFGRGSVQAFHVRDQRDLEFFCEYVDHPVVQRYLDGPEFTLDVLCDFDGHPISIVPRERVVIRAGVIDRGRTVADEQLIDLAIACTRAIRFRGPINIQCRMLEGRPTVFEINPRFSGGIPLTIAAGGNFPVWLVDLALGREVRPRIGEYTPDLWMTNYDAQIFVPGGARDVLRPVPAPDPVERC